MTLFWGAVVFTIGGLIQTLANGFVMMLLGRIISGFGVGLLSYVPHTLFCGESETYLRILRTIVPIYQSEISPPNHVRIIDETIVYYSHV